MPRSQWGSACARSNHNGALTSPFRDRSLSSPTLRCKRVANEAIGRAPQSNGMPAPRRSNGHVCEWRHGPWRPPVSRALPAADAYPESERGRSESSFRLQSAWRRYNCPAMDEKRHQKGKPRIDTLCPTARPRQPKEKPRSSAPNGD